MKEKKHIIGIIFATLAAFLWADNAHCQQALTQASYSATITNTIVREYKYPATISYVETTSEHHFAYADASMTVRNAVIDPDLFFTDMQVHGDYVYFCGYNIAMSKAVWGWFDINNVINCKF